MRGSTGGWDGHSTDKDYDDILCCKRIHDLATCLGGHFSKPFFVLHHPFQAVGEIAHIKRFGEVDEVAGAALYLASETSAFTTGSVLVVDGGTMAS